MKFAWTNSDYNESDIVFIGVPDESGSHSIRKGTKHAPDAIRKVSNKREVFERDKKTVALPQLHKINKNIHDYGNVRKKLVSKLVKKINMGGKTPVVVGGDHSITAEVLKGLDSVKKISVVYFDAHPDFICSTKHYYGSVVCDISEYKNINFKTSVEVGIRAPEPEELVNLRKKHITTIYAVDIIDLGVKKVFRKIKSRVGKYIYISIDMDVLDPAFAPGVSSPVPGGLNSNELIYLLKKLSGLKLVGFDVMETNPKYDIQYMTSHLASRIIIEMISSMK